MSDEVDAQQHDPTPVHEDEGPAKVPLEAAQESARLATLAILASLKRSVGDLDRVTAWLMVNVFVNADPGYPRPLSS
jgi:hypothetical protein